MFTLYYKPTCAYCQSVIGEAEALGVHLYLKDILSDEKNAEELVALCGKRQTPFLFDDVSGVKMHESNDIIAYLKEQGKGDSQVKTFGGLRVHTSPEVCDTCQ